MSGPHVARGEMNFRGIADADIEALIAGDPVAGAPDHLIELVGALRSEFDTTPTVGVGTALGEFIDVVDLTAIPAASTSGRRAGLATKALAVVGAVSANVLLGTAVAVASVGAAHALGVVDVPGLPSRAPAVSNETPEPPLAGDDPANNTPAGRRELPDQVTNRGEGAVGPSDASDDGCEFGQETSQARSQQATNAVRGGLPIDPCTANEEPLGHPADQFKNISPGVLRNFFAGP